jgi:hypothetical protein
MPQDRRSTIDLALPMPPRDRRFRPSRSFIAFCSLQNVQAFRLIQNHIRAGFVSDRDTEYPTLETRSPPSRHTPLFSGRGTRDDCSIDPREFSWALRAHPQQLYRNSRLSVREPQDSRVLRMTGTVIDCSQIVTKNGHNCK